MDRFSLEGLVDTIKVCASILHINIQHCTFWSLFELRIFTFESRLGLISGLRDQRHLLCQIILRESFPMVIARRICLRVYENAMKQNHWLDKVISSFAGLKIWQRRKRWSRITPSLNISNVLMRRNDKHCGLLAFKFSALITLEGLMLLIEVQCDHCNFRFLLEHISAVYKDTKWWGLEKVCVWSWPRL